MPRFNTLALSPDSGDGGGAPEVVTFKHGDQEIAVPREALKGWVPQQEVDEKFIPKSAHNDQMARMRRDLDATKGKKDPDELLNDAEFKSKAVQTWGLDPNATNEQFKTQLERQRAELVEREIKPREAKLEKAGSEIGKLRQKDLRGQIIQTAAALKVEEKYLKSPTKGGKPLLVSMLEDAFGFDGEHNEWFAKGDNGTYAFSQSGELPYQTVAEWMQGWVNGDGKEFVRSERQSGAESSPDGTPKVPGQVGKELRLNADQIRDTSFFKKMAEKAEKEGLTIVPI
jgi:hypothetical protein